MVPTDEKTDVIRAVVQEFGRNLRARTAPIDEVVAEQHPVGARIGTDIGLVGSTVLQAMMRISLAPTVSLRVSGINIVPECLLLAAAQVRFFDLESLIVPILIKRHRARDSHDIYKLFFATTSFRPGSDNPVADLCDAPDSRLTRCESADSEERVGRESVVSGHNI